MSYRDLLLEAEQTIQNLEGIIKMARDYLKMTIDSLEEGRPQITHSYYVACLHVKLNDLDFILKGIKAKAQSDSPCMRCENGKDGYCDEAEFIISSSGVEACLTYRPIKPISEFALKGEVKS